MIFNVEKAKKDLEDLKDSFKRLADLKSQNPYLLNIKTYEEYVEQIEECDRQLALINDRYDKLSDLGKSDEDLEELKDLMREADALKRKNEVLEDSWSEQIKTDKLIDAIVRNVLQPVAKKKEEDIHSLLNDANNANSPEDLKLCIDAICISFYKVPLLVALITRDPIEIEEDFQVSGLKEEIRDKVVGYIEQRKIDISNNLILSDKALIDLIEHTTGGNIVNQQRHNERENTGFNRQFDGQLLLEKGSNYTLLRNQDAWNKSTVGIPIKRFYEKNSASPFDRKDYDMLVRNYPDVASEDLVFRSFKSLKAERKKLVISSVISNLKLCYEMFNSYYLSDKVEVPVLINLTNGMTLPCKFDKENISHILGIPATHETVFVGNQKLEIPNLPQATLDTLRLEKGNALTVLEHIIDNEDRIIDSCGLNYDASSKTYLEMLPWERIILKTNAFIRGDFFKTTSLISPVNPNSFLVGPRDEIERISIVSTRFSQPAINQELINPDISFEEAVKMLRKVNTPSDFTFKGMKFDDNIGVWIPKTNVSAIGERITPNNAGTIKTLEKYRYLISGISDPSEGGFVASVESSNGDDLYKEYLVQEMITSLVEIADSFGKTEEIEANLREYLGQIQQVQCNTKKH